MRALDVVLAGVLLWTNAGTSTAPKRVDACALFSKTEIQALIGRTPMDGRKNDVAELSSCAYGNPRAPLVNGQPTDVLLTIAVFNGERPKQGREGGRLEGTRASASLASAFGARVNEARASIIPRKTSPGG